MAGSPSTAGHGSLRQEGLRPEGGMGSAEPPCSFFILDSQTPPSLPPKLRAHGGQKQALGARDLWTQQPHFSLWVQFPQLSNQELGTDKRSPVTFLFC